MTLDTYVTRSYRYAEALALGVYPEDGILVHGLLLEGARWTDEEESTDDVYNIAGTACAGHLTESRLKQLLSPMPVVYVRAIPVQSNWLPTSVGYLRGDSAEYECPVYLTSARGGTFVFLATLRSIEAPLRWVLAGVVILLQSDD
jgi:dynein heavy chain